MRRVWRESQGGTEGELVGSKGRKKLNQDGRGPGSSEIKRVEGVAARAGKSLTEEAG